MSAKLVLEDGTIFQGEARGYKGSTSGEVVFTTGMVGYDLSLTDPSFRGQILTFTYPLIGNWGVPPKKFWESEKIHTKGVITSDLTDKPGHWQSEKTLEQWLIENKVPAIVNIDTRALTQKLRDHGVMLGKIIVDGKDIEFDDPNKRNLVAEVSIDKPRFHLPNSKLEYRNSKQNQNYNDENSKGLKNSDLENSDLFRASDFGFRLPAGQAGISPVIALLNCGAKRNIVNCLTKKGATVYELPWNYDPFANNLKFDGLVISNGPGDPKMATDTINIIGKALDKKIPTFGICLGNQLLALAAGGDTYKLKFGHRSQNQPTLQVDNLPRLAHSSGEAGKRCYITTQNHGYAVDEKKLPKGFKPWFTNANDNTNEGIIHDSLPFFSVQFHPEAAPGPTDTKWLFDYFLERIRRYDI